MTDKLLSSNKPIRIFYQQIYNLTDVNSKDKTLTIYYMWQGYTCDKEKK